MIEKEDSIYWGLNANGYFTVKSATLIQNSTVKHNSRNLMLKKMRKLNILVS